MAPRYKLFIIFLFSVLLNFQLVAQQWGYYTHDEINYDAQQSGSNSDAVIFFDIGEKYINSHREVVFKHHRRLKVLTENGKKYGDISIIYGKYDEFEDIETLVRLPNGEIIELDEDDIYEQSIEYYKQKVFSLHGIEIGSIIEYRYELVSSSVFFLQPWHFQNDEITLKSEFTFIYPKSLEYDSNVENSYGFKIHHEQQKTSDPYDYYDKVTIDKWYTKNIPALREEPFMYNFYDNYAKIIFQIKTFQVWFFTVNISNSWVDVVNIQKNLYNSILKKSTGIDSLAKSIKIDFLSPLSNARNLYNYVRDNIIVVDKKGFVNDSLPNVLESNKVSKIEKNLFLISLLRESGYTVDLLLISSRDNGKFSKTTVNLRHLNHVLAYLTIDKRHYILDCTNKFCPFGILPINYNVERGVLVKEDKMKIIQVFQSNLNNTMDISTEAFINSSGELDCRTHLKLSGIPAIIERTRIDEMSQIEYIEELLSKTFISSEIDTFYLPNYFILDSPLDIWIKFRVPEYAQFTDSIIYFETPLISKLKANPFIQENRNFPIDYSYEIFQSEFINITIPNGYNIEEAPERSKEVVQGCTFNSLIFTGNQSIEIRRNFRLKQLSFFPKYYKSLKNLYDAMVQSDQSQIVLQKIN